MQSFIITLLICSAAMSVLALAYMAIIPFLSKRYSEKACYYAWLIVIVGLIIPFRPQWGNALINIEVPSNAPQPTVVQMNGEATINILLPIALPPVENVIVADSTLNISWWQIVTAVWLAGLMMFITYHGIKHYCFVKMVRRWSKNITDEFMLSLLQSLKSEVGITRRIPIYLCPCLGSPMMVGLIKPRILLPTVELAQDELCFILKHELVHCKRKDLLYKYLILGATALHWFNPIVYLMAKAVNLLCETSCDAAVLQGANMDTRQFYGETIIGAVQYQSKLKTAFSTTFYGGKNSMNKRISSIMDIKKKKVGVTIIVMALIATIGTGFVFSANANTAMDDDSNEIPYLSENTQENDIENPAADEFFVALETGGMIQAQGINGINGWVYARDLEDYPAPNTPEEALARQTQRNLDYPDGIKYINVYDIDGQTILDTFAVGVGSNNVIYEELNDQLERPTSHQKIQLDTHENIDSTGENFQSPYRIAESLEEVRAIWALQDGTIPVTSIDVPEIINHQADGIIITWQDLNEAIAVMDEYNRQNDEIIAHLVTTRLLPPMTPEEFESSLMIGFAQRIAKAALDAGLNPEGVEILDSRSFYISSAETGERLREEARRVLALHGEPSEELALEAAQRLFGGQ